MDVRVSEDNDNNEHPSDEESGVGIKYEEQPPTLLPENVVADATTVRQQYSKEQFDVKINNKFEEQAPPILLPVDATAPSQPAIVVQQSAVQQNSAATDVASQASTERKYPLAIWEGSLEWQDKEKNPDPGKPAEKPDQCRITITANSQRDKAGLNADSWPLNMILHLVSERVLRNLRGTALRKAPSARGHVRDLDSRNALRKALSPEKVGFVFLTPPSSTGGSRVMILQYSSRRQMFAVKVQSYTHEITERLERAVLYKEARRRSMRKKQGQVETPRRVNTEIWNGTLQWADTNSASRECGNHKKTACRVLAKITDDETEVRADSWPRKLVVQLVPKRLIKNIGEAYLKDSKCVLFQPTACEALDDLTNVMSSRFAGCIRFTSVPTLGACETKVVVLLYSAAKEICLGFIPNDQTEYINRLENLSQQEDGRPKNMKRELPETMPTFAAARSVEVAPRVEEHESANVMVVMNASEALKIQDGTEIRGRSFGIPSKQENETESGGTLQPQDKGRGTKRRFSYPMQRARELNLLMIESLSRGIDATKREMAMMEKNLEVARQQEKRYQEQELEQESEYTVNQVKKLCDDTRSA